MLIADSDLRQRLQSDATLDVASKVIDLPTAEKAVNMVLQQNMAAATAWLASSRALERFDADVRAEIGYGFKIPMRPRTYVVRTSPLTKARVIVRKVAGAHTDPFVVVTELPIA